jgi:hypothetical protein
MSMMTNRFMNIGAAAVLAGGMLVAAAVVPTAPSSEGVFTACYNNGGTMQLVDEGASCPDGWNGPVTWNQQGQPGPQGEQGPAGADSTVPGPKGDPGAPGEQGPAGEDAVLLSGMAYDIVVIKGRFTTDTDPDGYALIECPDGKKGLQANAFIGQMGSVATLPRYPLYTEWVSAPGVASSNAFTTTWLQYPSFMNNPGVRVYYEMTCATMTQ